MDFTTRKKPVTFSRREQRLYDLLPADGSRITSSDLVAAYYGDQIPLHGRATVIAMMRSILAKIEFADLEPKVQKTKRSGPHPVQFWIGDA